MSALTPRTTVQIVVRSFSGNRATEAVGTVRLDTARYDEFTAEMAKLLAKYDYRAECRTEHTLV